MTPKKTLGSEIRRLRLQAEITLRSFATELGHTAAHQSDIEHGRRMPSEKVLRKIAAKLGRVGASYEAFKELDTRLGEDLEALLKKNPEARALLRETRAKAKDSNRSVRDVLDDLRESLRDDEEGDE